jgi:hypothetical protein
MQKKTRSILEELESMYVQRDRRHLLESRASNVITSAIRLMEQIERDFPGDQAENLQRKMLNAIRLRDLSKFTRSIRRTGQGNENEII